MTLENQNPITSEKTGYTVFVSTHPGSVRDDNEDNYIVNNIVRAISKTEANLCGEDIKEPLVCGVFDGMGGESHGELASKICADQAIGVYRALNKNTESFENAVNTFVTNSNDAVLDMLEKARARRGGSTFVLVVIKDSAVYPYSLGDSRLYLLRQGGLMQITNDHTLAMKKYLANIYTLEEAQESNDSHKLTSFLGVDFDQTGLSPERYAPFILEPGDKLLLCSDGLYDMCSDDEILSVLRTDSHTISLDLVKRALKNGGKDNVTCIVIEKTGAPLPA